jgi:hypothetical protein
MRMEEERYTSLCAYATLSIFLLTAAFTSALTQLVNIWFFRREMNAQ